LGGGFKTDRISGELFLDFEIPWRRSITKLINIIISLGKKWECGSKGKLQAPKELIEEKNISKQGLRCKSTAQTKIMY